MTHPSELLAGIKRFLPWLLFSAVMVGAKAAGVPGIWWTL